MGVLQRFERRIEEMVNRPFARAFKAEVQPVEIASALQRECDDRAAIVARGRTMVPNRFTVRLGEHDHERLKVYSEPLSDELSSMVREHAEEQGYSFLGPVTVGFEQDDALDTGRFRVLSSAAGGGTASDRAGNAGDAGDAHDAGAAGGSPRRSGSPWLQVGPTTYGLTKPVTHVGRGAENDLRIDDLGVSRHHADIRRQGGDVTIVDNGSTNGIVVNGHRVEQARLDDGASIVLGSTTLVFHDGAR